VGIVAEIEQQLARLREQESGSGAPILRTSTMTHLVWAPPTWLPQARATLAGLHDRHPARTILLVPEPKRATGLAASTSLYAIGTDGERDAYAEVIEIRVRGDAVAHPASVVLPLLVADLPVFCRWRGEPEWDSSQLAELVGVVDRFVVNSSEWRALPKAYEHLAALFERTAVSDIAYSRTVNWRARLAERWPALAHIERLRVEGQKADALLLAGWLRSRLRRPIKLTHRSAPEVRRVRADGEEILPPIGEVLTGSDLLSAELDVFGRDPVYEAAALAAV
jgi:glucose-6-phosphate dehydrogenase assembly protein OpcA